MRGNLRGNASAKLRQNNSAIHDEHCGARRNSKKIALVTKACDKSADPTDEVG